MLDNIISIEKKKANFLHYTSTKIRESCINCCVTALLISVQLQEIIRWTKWSNHFVKKLGPCLDKN